MNIFIYGDSNTFGYKPNLEGYSKDAKIEQYDKKDIWWHKLVKYNKLKVNALCGRAINKDHPIFENRNSMNTILEDIKNINNCDIFIIMLGTNDCKSKYNLTSEEITTSLQSLIKLIETKLNTKFLIISPPKIKEGNKITDNYYVGAEKKSEGLDILYKKLAEKEGCLFVSALNCEVGEDGEHLTINGHKNLGEKVYNKLKYYTYNLI